MRYPAPVPARSHWARHLVRGSLIVTLASLLTVAFAQEAMATDPDPPVVNVYYFWGDGCPVCAQQRVFLDWLEEHYPEVRVHAFEVYYETVNRLLLQAFSDAFDQAVVGVPVTFIADQGWIGFNQQMSLHMTAKVEAHRSEPLPDAAERLESDLRQQFLAEPPSAE